MSQIRQSTQKLRDIFTSDMFQILQKCLKSKKSSLFILNATTAAMASEQINITFINSHSREVTLACAASRESEGICCCTRQRV